MTISEFIRSVFSFLRLWVVVVPWEQCVRVRLGKHVRMLRAGFHFTLPMLDKIYIEKCTMRTSNVYCQSVATRDGYTAVVKAVIQYRIIDLLKLCREVANPEDILIDCVATKVANIICKTDSGELSPEAFNKERIGVCIPGLEIERVSVTDLILTRRAYRLVTDKVTEYIWGSKVELKSNQE